MDPVPSIPSRDDDPARRSPSDTPPARILFVCTANRIRSPFAAAVACRLIAEHGLPLEAASAGFDEGGMPAMDPMVRVAREWDVDLVDHESRRVTTELIDSSDLTIAMTGSHVVDLASEFPFALSRLVTLQEVAQATQETGPPEWNATAMREWGAAVTRRPLNVLLSGTLDVVDPVGRSRRVHRRTAALIHDLVTRFLIPVCDAD